MLTEREELLQPYPVEISLRIHDGARHGYALPNREMFDARAAACDWALTCAMFHRQSPPCAG